MVAECIHFNIFLKFRKLLLAWQQRGRYKGESKVLQNLITIHHLTKMSQKFCNILVHATLHCITTETVQAVKGTHCSW